MATYDITVSAQSAQGQGASDFDALTGGNAPPGDFDGSTITDVSVVGTPTVTTDGLTDDDIGVRFGVTDSSVNEIYGSFGSDAGALCAAFFGELEFGPVTIVDGSSQSPAPSTVVIADWDRLTFTINYSANMMADDETLSWSSFTIRVTYTPVVPADVLQTSYRFCGGNGGVPITGTDHELWTLLGIVDTSFEIELDTDYALIVKLGNDGGTATGLDNWQLEYNVDGGGWNDVNLASSNVRTVFSGDTDSATSGSERLTGTARGFGTSRLDEVDGAVGQSMIVDTDYEFYYALTFRSAELSGGEEIEFRVSGDGGDNPTYNITPTATVETGGTVTALATSTLTGTLVANGEHNIVTGTSTLTGDLVAAGTQLPLLATATSTIIGDIPGAVGRHPSVECYHWRWADDDNASHESCTLLGSEDTSFEIPEADYDTGFNIIFKLWNNGGAGAGPEQRDFQLQCNIDSGGWNDVTDSSTGVQYFNGQDGNFTQSAVERLTTTGGTFQSSRYFETGLATLSLGNTADFEFYYCVTFLDADLSGGESIEFRILFVGPLGQSVPFNAVSTAICTIEAGVSTATATSTIPGDLVADGRTNAFATSTITGDLVANGEHTGITATSTLIGDLASDAVILAFAPSTFIGELQAGGGTQFAQGTSTLIGDLAAIGGAYVFVTATSTIPGDLVSRGTTSQPATSTLIGNLVAAGYSENDATATSTLIGDLGAIGIDLSDVEKFAAATSTLIGDLVVAPVTNQPGTSTLIGTLVADGINLAQATSTLIGDCGSVGTTLALATSTFAGTLVGNGEHNIVTATSTLIGDLGAFGVDLTAGEKLAIATSTITGDLVADGVTSQPGTSTLIGTLIADGVTTAAATSTLIGNLIADGVKPDVDVYHWRWSDDDNAAHELTTFLETEDTAHELPIAELGNGKNLVLKIWNDGGKGSEERQFQLQYNKDSGGWNDVTASSSNVRAFNGQDSDFANTGVERLTDPGGTFNSSRYYEPGFTNINVGNNSMFEFYFSIEFRAADNSGGESYEFRIEIEGDLVGFNGVAAATATIEAALVTATATSTLIGDLVADGVTQVTATSTLLGDVAAAGTKFGADVRIHHYRWADDDNAAHESSTFVAAEDTPYEVPLAELDTGYLLVAKMFNEGTAGENGDFQLQVNVDAGGWNDVDGASTYVRSYNGLDSDFASGVPERLTATAGQYQNSKLTEQSIINLNLGADFDFEFYYSITFRSADLSGGESLEFRIQAGGSDLTHNETMLATIEAVSGPFPYHVIRQKRRDMKLIVTL